MTSIVRHFPRSSSELTSDWLTMVLQSSGAVAPGSSVTSFRADRIAEGVGFASFLYRVHLGLDGDGPATVIIKWPTDYPTYLELAQSIRLYEREVAFYNDVAPTAPLNAPRAYFAEFDQHTNEFVIVMEDLAELENADHLAGLSIDRAVAVFDELGAFHAWGWDCSRLPTNNAAFLALDDARMSGLFAVGATAGWSLFLEHRARNRPRGSRRKRTQRVLRLGARPPRGAHRTGHVGQRRPACRQPILQRDGSSTSPSTINLTESRLRHVGRGLSRRPGLDARGA